MVDGKKRIRNRVRKKKKRKEMLYDNVGEKTIMATTYSFMNDETENAKNTRGEKGNQINK